MVTNHLIGFRNYSAHECNFYGNCEGDGDGDGTCKRAITRSSGRKRINLHPQLKHKPRLPRRQRHVTKSWRIQGFTWCRNRDRKERNVHAVTDSKGSFILVRKRKRHRFQMGSWRIQFNVHFENLPRSKKENRFCFRSV